MEPYRTDRVINKYYIPISKQKHINDLKYSMKGYDMKHKGNPGEVSINEEPWCKIWESGRWVAILDKYPLVEGHALILPKRKASHLNDLDEEQLREMGPAIKHVSMMLTKAYGEGILVSIKCGKGSARTISHLHIHVIPRKAGDRLWDGDRSRIVLDRTSDFPRLEMSDDEMKAIAEKIKEKNG